MPNERNPKRHSSQHLVFQEILDNLDDSYIDFDESHIEFSVGRVIKNSKFNKLKLHVRCHDSAKKVRLGTKGLIHYIVIDCDPNDGMPDDEKSLFDLLQSKPISTRIISKIKTFLQAYVSNGDSEASNEYEADLSGMTAEELTQKYKQLLKDELKKLATYKQAIKEIQNKVNNSVNYKQSSLAKLAQESLIKEYFGGDTSKAYAKKVMSEQEWAKSIDKDAKNKLQQRMIDFFEEKIRPELKD